MPSEYWLFRWMDEHGAPDSAEVVRLLRSELVVESFREAAFEAEQELQKPVAAVPSIVAGAGIDLTGRLDCVHPDCRRKQIDKLFRHAWHYFDTVILPDTVSHAVVYHWRQNDAAEFDRWLSDSLAVYSHLRGIGAADLVTFREPLRHAVKPWRELINTGAIALRATDIETVVKTIAREAKVGVSDRSPVRVTHALDHPYFEHTQWVETPREELPRNGTAIQELLAERVVDRFVTELIHDIELAHHFDRPLASTVELHHRVLRPVERAAPERVAFDLELPVLGDIPIATLLQLRQDERELFERFRGKLRKAISELVAAGDCGYTSQIAAQIQRDLIEPELRSIRDRLASARSLFAKRSALGGGLGVIATTCGLMLGPPGYAAAAIGAVLAVQSLTSASDKHFERKHDVALSDLYFLWEAAGHDPHARDAL